MTKYKVNKAGVKKAETLVSKGRYDTESKWSKAAPSTREENDVIAKEGYDRYGEWHLAIDTEASEDTKDRYGFPYGDFEKVYRSALIHAKQRAKQNGHDAVAEAADRVLESIDKREGEG